MLILTLAALAEVSLGVGAMREARAVCAAADAVAVPRAGGWWCRVAWPNGSTSVWEAR